MKIIPAIDIKNGQCVRLFQGDPKQETVYSSNPADIAQLWESQGAELIHLVDLDGAFAEHIVNWSVIESIAHSVSVDLEIGGGIRSLADLKKLNNLGIKRFILGSSVVQNEGFLKDAIAKYGNSIIVGVDLKDGKFALKGWKDFVDLDMVGFLKKLEGLGIQEIIYTDIKRDGALVGPNLEMIKYILENSNLKVVVSGGISSADDILAVNDLKEERITGVITGKALYEKKFELKDIIRHVS